MCVCVSVCDRGVAHRMRRKFRRITVANLICQGRLRKNLNRRCVMGTKSAMTPFLFFETAFTVEEEVRRTGAKNGLQFFLDRSCRSHCLSRRAVRPRRCCRNAIPVSASYKIDVAFIQNPTTWGINFQRNSVTYKFEIVAFIQNRSCCWHGTA